jgi:hypothetical protein
MRSSTSAHSPPISHSALPFKELAWCVKTLATHSRIPLWSHSGAKICNFRTPEVSVRHACLIWHEVHNHPCTCHHASGHAQMHSFVTTPTVCAQMHSSVTTPTVCAQLCTKPSCFACQLVSVCCTRTGLFAAGQGNPDTWLASSVLRTRTKDAPYLGMQMVPPEVHTIHVHVLLKPTV